MSREIWEWRIRVEGQVQGVGFRAAVMRLAHLHRITGYVKNCSDGAVEIYAQGKESELDAFVEAVHVRIERHHSDTTFLSFEIR